MRKITFFLITVVAIWVLWRYYNSPAAEYQYGVTLQGYADTIYAPLTPETPNYMSSIRNTSARAAGDLEKGLIDREQARLIRNLCALLENAHAERDSFAARYRQLQNRDFHNLARRGADSKRMSERSRQFRITGHMRRWDEYVAQQRPRVLAHLEQLHELERDQMKIPRILRILR